MSEPYKPPGLEEIILSMSYKPGWYLEMRPFKEDGEVRCWALYVTSDTENSLIPSKRIRVLHEFVIPPVSWNERVWKAWLVDRLGDVEMHERNEFVQFNGVREFAPHHGNGEDPYRTWYGAEYDTAKKKRSGDD